MCVCECVCVCVCVCECVCVCVCECVCVCVCIYVSVCICVSTVAVCVSECVNARARTHVLLLCANKCTYTDTSFSHAESSQKILKGETYYPRQKHGAGPQTRTSNCKDSVKGWFGVTVYSSEISPKETGL